MTTIYDIARAAGVSIATVSRVLNNPNMVSEKTRRRVEAVMKELNYSPNIVAAALSSKRTYSIGLLLPDITNPFFAEIARGAEDEGNRHGFNVIICNTDNQLEKEKNYVSLLLQKQVDGLIFATAETDHQVIREVHAKNLPLVLIAREMRDLVLDAVLVDNRKGAYLATRHLLDLGHRYIAMVSEPLTITSSIERLEGYQQALEEAGLAVQEKLLFQAPSTLAWGIEAGHRLMELSPPPTAVFAGNDVLAIGVIKGIREKGGKVPEDVSVVGFDNTILAEVSDPPLTTVAQPIYEMGILATRKLINRMQSKTSSRIERTILQAELVVRKSTQPPKCNNCP